MRFNPLPGMMTIGASDHSKEIKDGKSLVASFSNHGNEAVHVFAPGYQIYSATPENNYAKYNGTSMASPAAAGAAALVLSQKTELSNIELQDLILSNARNEAYRLPSQPPTYVLGQKDHRVDEYEQYLHEHFGNRTSDLILMGHIFIGGKAHVEGKWKEFDQYPFRGDYPPFPQGR